ncbi:hypothetical protein ACOBWA_09030 [Psychrobacter sp. ER1]|uniref:hypothetical protein n=1 Tax=Psychrobacter sp. ER1 TaxID=3406645 RepID=UPI003B4302F4
MKYQITLVNTLLAKTYKKETMALLIDFFGAYEGIKVPRRLADQRSALKLGFETAQEDENPKKGEVKIYTDYARRG